MHLDRPSKDELVLAGESTPMTEDMLTDRSAMPDEAQKAKA